MAMNVIHTQEAVFAFFMGLGILMVIEGQWLLGGWWRSKHPLVLHSLGDGGTSNIQHPTSNEEIESARVPTVNMLKIHVLFIGGLIVFGLLLFYSLHKPMVSYGYSEFLLRPLFHGEWLGQKWFIQPPSGQFFQVLTWWGLFVYALFLIYIRQFLRQPFILAGMLMPFLIVFNPLTLMIITRWVTDLNVIYRFNYMIPLPFVAGFLALRFWGEIKLHLPAKHAKGRENILNAKDAEPITARREWTSFRNLLFHAISPFSVISRVSRAIIIQIKSRLCWHTIWAGICLLSLFVLLMPWEPLLGMRSNSRFYTLKPVPEGNDQRRWGDLIALVRTHPQAHVLTDHYTFILLRWMDVNVMDGGWWIAPSAKGADRLALLRKLDQQYDWWLVVNRRNGEFSMNGARSGHWWSDALTHFATAYPDDMLLFVKEHPELFNEIWSRDQIRVYDIVEGRIGE